MNLEKGKRMNKIPYLLLVILLCGCVTINTSKKIDLVPDKIEARYKTDDHFHGTGYEFTTGWVIK